MSDQELMDLETAKAILSKNNCFPPRGDLVRVAKWAVAKVEELEGQIEDAYAGMRDDAYDEMRDREAVAYD